MEKDGTVAMTGDLNVGDNIIKNVSFPHQKNDAANKEYVEKQIDRIATHPDHYKDVFSYLMSSGSHDQWTDEIVNRTSFSIDKIDDLAPSSGNFHDYNHKVIYITIFKESKNKINYKMGINFYRLKGNTDYTLCLELLNTDLILWNETKISVDKGTSTGLTIGKVDVSKHYHSYTDSKGQQQNMQYHRIIVNFRKLSSGNKFFLHILVNIQTEFMPPSIKNKFSGLYLIAYGVEGTVSNIDPDKVYDYHSAFVIKPTEVVYNVDINTNNKKILNIALDKNNNNSAATVGMVKEIHPFTTNNIYRQYFERFYDFTNASQYTLNIGSSGVVINGLKSIATDGNTLNKIIIPNRHLRDIKKEGIDIYNTISFPTPNFMTDYTLCIVFYHWRNRSFNLSKKNSDNDNLHLRLIYNKINNKLSLNSAGSVNHITLPNSFNGKKIVLWLVEKSSSRITKVRISNYSSTISISAVQNSNNQKFDFTSEGGVINKIMLSKNFYDFDSEQYHKLIIQEKLNGSYLE